jgi:tRNA threonylcarbamoyladenosine biosynthesis protein TsaE
MILPFPTFSTKKNATLCVCQRCVCARGLHAQTEHDTNSKFFSAASLFTDHTQWGLRDLALPVMRTLVARVMALAAAAPRAPAASRRLEMRRASTTTLIASPARGPISFACATPSATLALGAAIAEACGPGDVVLLRGDYGAGKTCLARGFVWNWYGDPDEPVTSPSYLIDNVYPDDAGRALRPGVTVHHMDLWRLPEGKVAQLVDLPSVFSECVSLIEWPDRLGDAMPAEHLSVSLSIDDGALEPAGGDDDGAAEDTDEQPRVATLSATGESWARRLPAIVERAQNFEL